ncbi:hypothetical protein JR065_05860 [Xanthomonas sp. AmX2]|uniref:hypothetical protein n=1 Tax=Xanthomonas sp. TaxID=29446 RepID=UPI00197FADBA|nr:hypothetical protein [Xanthomonas sp.]MBN6149857.1 hypothetical protein [Xanthomonas sp.]
MTLRQYKVSSRIGVAIAAAQVADDGVGTAILVEIRRAGQARLSATSAVRASFFCIWWARTNQPAFHDTKFDVIVNLSCHTAHLQSLVFPRRG